MYAMNINELMNQNINFQQIIKAVNSVQEPRACSQTALLRLDAHTDQRGGKLKFHMQYCTRPLYRTC